MGIFQFIKSKSFLKQLFIACAGLLLFVFLISKWLTLSTNHSQKIEVPTLKSATLISVQNTLDELDLTWVVIDSASYNPNYPKKTVIDQSPAAGDFVKEKRKIYVTLNPSGYKNVEIPNLYGTTKRRAISELKARGFRISADTVYVSDIAKGIVRGLKINEKDLKAGDKIPKNTFITLKLGDGKGSKRYVQPSKKSNK